VIEHASNDRGAGYAESALRHAPPHIIAKVNLARVRCGLPQILPPAPAERAVGIYWDPASPHRPRTDNVVVAPRAPVHAAGVRALAKTVTRVLIMPVYGDAAARDVGRSLPEAISPIAFGSAANLNARGDWSLKDDHDGPVLDYAGPQLRAHDTAHGLVLEWLPNPGWPWATDAVRSIEDGNAAVSVSMIGPQRRIAHLPHPVELVTRAQLDHVALLLRGQRGCYAGGRAKVFRDSRADDKAQLAKQIGELIAACRWHARKAGGRH
jgi:hypothetical protein